MKRALKILLLAGSAEARAIAQSLVDLGAEVSGLVSEPPRGPNPTPVPFELCPSLYVDALITRARGCDAMIDASHGFDGQMTQVGFAAAQALDIPFAGFQRPGWEDQIASCQHFATIADALCKVKTGMRVFSATGWASLPDYRGFAGAVLMLRQTNLHDRLPPYGFVELVFGAAPFDVASETALFEEKQVDLLICRNLGGRASRPKVDAALALGIKVALIDRPAWPQGATSFAKVDQIIEWTCRL